MKVQFSITAVDPFDLPRLFAEVPIDRLDAIHIDVTDGRFAPGFSWGWQTVRAVTCRTPIPTEVHLMIEHPERHFGELAEMRVRRVGFHLEASDYPLRTAARARSFGLHTTLCLNPKSLGTDIQYLAGAVDRVCVLTTEPDHEGEQFLHSLLPGIERLRASIGDLPLQADGGITREVLPVLRAVGVNEVVIGRALLDDHLQLAVDVLAAAE